MPPSLEEISQAAQRTHAFIQDVKRAGRMVPNAFIETGRLKVLFKKQLADPAFAASLGDNLATVAAAVEALPAPEAPVVPASPAA